MIFTAILNSPDWVRAYFLPKILILVARVGYNKITGLTVEVDEVFA